MWGWGPNVKGYCGAESIQSAGIFFGNYFSQEQVRYADGDNELLIGVNDQTAATALSLVNQEWVSQKHFWLSFLSSTLIFVPLSMGLSIQYI